MSSLEIEVYFIRSVLYRGSTVVREVATFEGYKKDFPMCR